MSIALAALAVVALAGACGTQAIAGGLGPDRRPDAVALDWTSRTVSGALPGGWRAEFCEGEGPFVCVSREGQNFGVVELGDHPLPSSTLEDWAREHLAWVTSDRVAGCAPGYRVVADPIREVEVAGREGIRLAFTGIDHTGAPVERAVLHSWLHQGRHFVIAARGYADDSCLGRSFSDFTIEGLRAFEPVLDRLAGASVVNPPIIIGG